MGAPSFMPNEDEPNRDCRGDVLGVKEAAEIVGVSRTHLRRLASTKQVACTRIGTEQRSWYVFGRDDLDRYRQQRELRKNHMPRLRNGRLQCSLHEAVALLEAGLIDISISQLPKPRSLRRRW